MNDDIIKILKDCLFFTGAGFSKPAGCLLSSEMLKDLEQRSNDESQNSIFSKSERKAIKFILSCLDYQARFRSLESNGKYVYYPNIEEFAQLLRRIKNRENLLPYPVTGNWSDKILIIEQEYNNEKNNNPEEDIYTSIENKIKKSCYTEWLKHKSDLQYLAPLKNLLKNNNNFKIDIFTLNNDIILEVYFSDENSVYTGFVSNKWVGFDRSNIDNDTFNASRINYYKLHGSINWLRLSDGTIMEQKINNKNSNLSNNFKSSNAISNKDYDEINFEDIEIKPLLIFGHGTKIYTIDPFFSLLEQFKRALKEKKFFIIIGYSFFDPHINNLIFNELSINQEKIMIIINPKMMDNLNDEDFEDKDKSLKILKNEKKLKLVEYLSNIQDNPIYTELPDFNIKKISSDSFEYISCNTEDFMGKIQNILMFIINISKEKQQKSEMF
jgi:hypothetical protein